MILKNGMSLEISKADKSDAKHILAYLDLVGGESDNLLFGKNEMCMTIEAEEHFIGNLVNSNTSTMLVGKVDHEIACVGTIISQSKPRIAHQANIAVSVQKKYWGIGVGTQLMQALIHFAKENGKTEVLHLGVKADNDTALRLYKKLGFTEIGRYPNFFKIQDIYFDEILMNLYL